MAKHYTYRTRREMMKLSFGLSAYLFTGCKSTNNINQREMKVSSPETKRNVSRYEILVERSTIMTNCIVIDKKGKTAIERDGGIYMFKKEPHYPIYVFSGVVNVTQSGHITEGDIKNTLVLEASSSRIVTIVTTLASQKDKRAWIKENFNLTDKEIDTEIPRNNKKIAAISDEVLKYCSNNNINSPANIKIDALHRLTDTTLLRIEKYESTETNSIELEKELAQTLNLPLANKKDVNYYKHGSTNPKIVIDQLPKYPLTDEQKYALAFMWNEERLAGDAYGAFYTSLYPTLNNNEKILADRILKVIHHAERLHEEAVESLIKKYDIDILDLSDYDGTYSKEELKNMDPGKYPIKKLQELWDKVAPIGTNTLKDAFTIGVITESGDIEDLDRYIKIADKAIDFRYVMEFLRDGSILHYWVFDKALKELGEKDGACYSAIPARHCKKERDFEINGDGGTHQSLLNWIEKDFI